jgi:hypothetical protein
MDRATTSTPDRRPLLAVVALAFVVAAIWAATALAAGGSSGGGASSDPASGLPFSFVDDGRPAADAPRGDCPDDGSGGSSGSSGSSTQSDGLGTPADV